MESIVLNFNKRPSLYATVFHALLGRSSEFRADKPLPKITVRQPGITIDGKNLFEFNKICKINTGSEIPITYPFCLVYPLTQRLLARKEAPLSLFQVLNSRMRILQHRPISSGEKLDISCTSSGIRLREKGLEMDVECTLKSAAETVWENTQTFYYRGNFGPPDTNYTPPQFPPIPEAPESARWFLGGGIGWRFSRISGDGNPIHYSRIYARLLGFRRDFVQPLVLIGSSLQHLLTNDGHGPLALDIALKAPVYYENNIILKTACSGDSLRFDICVEGNPLPCICGLLKFPATDDIRK